MIRKLHFRPWLLALGIAPVAAGCTVYSTTPAVVTEAHVVESTPPPPPPSAVHVWIEGQYRWVGRRYVWEPGRYERRPHPRARYVRGYWQPRGHVRIWVDGHWE